MINSCDIYTKIIIYLNYLFISIRSFGLELIRNIPEYSELDLPGVWFDNLPSLVFAELRKIPIHLLVSDGTPWHRERFERRMKILPMTMP